MSGAAVIYTAFAVLLVCFLGGLTVFAALGLLLDVLFCGAFIAIAVLARGGAKTCSGARSPLSNNRIRDCRFQQAVFATAIVGAYAYPSIKPQSAVTYIGTVSCFSFLPLWGFSSIGTTRKKRNLDRVHQTITRRGQPKSNHSGSVKERVNPTTLSWAQSALGLRPQRRRIITLTIKPSDHPTIPP